jgi:hypothetical protein
MKSLVQSINESMQKINERYSPKDEKLFWKWIEDLGAEKCIKIINDDDSYEEFYKLVAKLGTTTEQFEMFCDIFYDLSSDMLSIIEDDDPGMSDDSCEYASWSSPFYGEKEYKKALKAKDWTEVCDNDEGENCGYAMTPDDYENYISDNKEEPKGYK